MILGKYTFLMILSLVTMESLACESEPEKKVQNTSPIRTNKEYGKSPEGILAILPKKTVKITMVISG